MQVTVRRFYFSEPTDAGYVKLMEEVAERGIHVYEVLQEKGTTLPADGASYTVDPLHVFSNQLNTVEGLRLFDCYIGLQVTPRGAFSSIRQGYILEDDEGFAKLQELRNETYVCGYCGAQSFVSSHEGNGSHWCTKCIDSEYLTPQHLYMLRLQPVSDRSQRPNEVPQWVAEAYKESHKATCLRLLEKDHNRSMQNLQEQIQAEKDLYYFKTELAQAGLEWEYLDNLIHYHHDNRFVFGWRYPLTKEHAERVQSVLDAQPEHVRDMRKVEIKKA